MMITREAIGQDATRQDDGICRIHRILLLLILSAYSILSIPQILLSCPFIPHVDPTDPVFLSVRLSVRPSFPLRFLPSAPTASPYSTPIFFPCPYGARRPGEGILNLGGPDSGIWNMTGKHDLRLPASAQFSAEAVPMYGATGISSPTFKGEPSLVLENHALKVVVLPRRGAKVASIYVKDPGRELLWQYPGDAYPPLAPGSAFKPEDSSGFDDMFPTVNAEPYPFAPWAGRPLPDHGEVWSMPWETADSPEESPTFAVKGREFPYRLQKTLSLSGTALLVQYRVENLGESPFPCLWAAHPLFATRPGMRISLPDANMEACTRILVANPSEELGPQGSLLDYPCPSSRCDGAYGDEPGGAAYDAASDLSKIGVDTGLTRKFYFVKPLASGEVFLDDPPSGDGLGFRVALRFPADKVPYLGIWVNEGGWAGQNNIGIEPATAGMDSPANARRFGMEWILPPRGVREWWLEIETSVTKIV